MVQIPTPTKELGELNVKPPTPEELATIKWTLPDTVFEVVPELRTVLGPTGSLEDQTTFLFEATARLRHGMSVIAEPNQPRWKAAYQALSDLHDQTIHRATEQYGGYFDSSCQWDVLVAMLRFPHKGTDGIATFQLFSAGDAPPRIGGMPPSAAPDGLPLIALQGAHSAVWSIAKPNWSCVMGAISCGPLRIWNP